MAEPQVVLFGATGYTGRLTAAALGRQEVDFAVVGRDAAKLRDLATRTGASDTRIASVEDPSSVRQALKGARVLVTCVGPFGKLGDVAVSAALDTGTHYIDSAGEGPFITTLIAKDADAHAAGIAMVPAMGFDEVPADVAATLAVGGLDHPDLILTYDLPRAGSGGTVRSTLPILGRPGLWWERGGPRSIRAGAEGRWAPLPPPRGPRYTTAIPLGEAQLGPLHLDLASCRTFVVSRKPEAALMRMGALPLSAIAGLPLVGGALELVIPSGSGPDAAQREAPWTILAEARGASGWRNVALRGVDVYGLTAETLAAGAVAMAADGFAGRGVLSPVGAFGVDHLGGILERWGATTQIWTSD
ncbi:MAG TPA: saccharopine dehydrogenase NADP-binding domain-containing protein [Actinomycetota bacterium]|nr:saccharopine dehydrogenase NADP-binding domain-containing protein [Actinomycetota bacterium]